MMNESSALDFEDYRAFIPPALETLNIKPKTCLLTTKKSQNQDKNLFNFSLWWEAKAETGSDQPAKTKHDQLASNREKRTTTLSPKNRNIIQNCAKGILKCAPLLPPSIKCAGPCGKNYGPTELDILGRCSHFLCRNCTGLITNMDGSAGCSSFECMYQDIFSHLTEHEARQAYNAYVRAKGAEKERRIEQQHRLPPRPPKKFDSGIMLTTHENTPKDTSSNRELICEISPNFDRRGDCGRDSAREMPTGCESTASGGLTTNRVMDLFSETEFVPRQKLQMALAFEMVDVRVMVFEKKQKHTRRIHLRCEMSGSTNLKFALLSIMSERKMPFGEFENWGFFYCPGSQGQGMRTLTQLDLEQSSLCSFPTNNGALHFVVDAANFIRK